VLLVETITLVLDRVRVVGVRNN